MIEFSLSERLYTMLFRSARLLRRNSDIESDLPPGQLRTLALIRAIENPTQQKVLEFIQIRPASLSEMLSKLEKGGYIVRTRDEKDKRSVNIALTEKGIETNDKNYDKQRMQAISHFEVLTDTEKEQLFYLLKKLVNDWEEKEGK